MKKYLLIDLNTKNNEESYEEFKTLESAKEEGRYFFERLTESEKKNREMYILEIEVDKTEDDEDYFDGDVAFRF